MVFNRTHWRSFKRGEGGKSRRQAIYVGTRLVRPWYEMERILDFVLYRKGNYQRIFFRQDFCFNNISMAEWENPSSGKTKAWIKIWDTVRWLLIYHRWEVIVLVFFSEVTEIWTLGKKKYRIWWWIERERWARSPPDFLFEQVHGKSYNSLNRNSREGQVSLIHSFVSNQSSSILLKWSL